MGQKISTIDGSRINAEVGLMCWNCHPFALLKTIAPLEKRCLALRDRLYYLSALNEYIVSLNYAVAGVVLERSITDYMINGDNLSVTKMKKLTPMLRQKGEQPLTDEQLLELVEGVIVPIENVLQSVRAYVKNEGAILCM